MKHSDNRSEKNPRLKEQEVEVLYQKLGDRWYAFSLIDDEVFVGSLTPEEIIAQDKNAIQEKTRKKKIAATS